MESDDRNEEMLSSTMGNLLTNKEEKNDIDTTPTSSTDANTTACSLQNVLDDPISSTSCDIADAKKVADAEHVESPIASEKDLLDMNITGTPSEKITENVDDLVQDLENLLGESSSSYDFNLKEKDALTEKKEYTKGEEMDIDAFSAELEMIQEQSKGPFVPSKTVDDQASTSGRETNENVTIELSPTDIKTRLEENITPILTDVNFASFIETTEENTVGGKEECQSEIISESTLQLSKLSEDSGSIDNDITSTEIKSETESKLEDSEKLEAQINPISEGQKQDAKDNIPNISETNINEIKVENLLESARGRIEATMEVPNTLQQSSIEITEVVEERQRIEENEEEFQDGQELRTQKIQEPNVFLENALEQPIKESQDNLESQQLVKEDKEIEMFETDEKEVVSDQIDSVLNKSEPTSDNEILILDVEQHSKKDENMVSAAEEIVIHEEQKGEVLISVESSVMDHEVSDASLQDSRNAMIVLPEVSVDVLNEKNQNIISSITEENNDNMGDDGTLRVKDNIVATGNTEDKVTMINDNTEDKQSKGDENEMLITSEEATAKNYVEAAVEESKVEMICTEETQLIHEIKSTNSLMLDSKVVAAEQTEMRDEKKEIIKLTEDKPAMIEAIEETKFIAEVKDAVVELKTEVIDENKEEAELEEHKHTNIVCEKETEMKSDDKVMVLIVQGEGETSVEIVEDAEIIYEVEDSERKVEADVLPKAASVEKTGDLLKIHETEESITDVKIDNLEASTSTELGSDEKAGDLPIIDETAVREEAFKDVKIDNTEAPTSTESAHDQTASDLQIDETVVSEESFRDIKIGASTSTEAISGEMVIEVQNELEVKQDEDVDFTIDFLQGFAKNTGVENREEVTKIEAANVTDLLSNEKDIDINADQQNIECSDSLVPQLGNITDETLESVQTVNFEEKTIEFKASEICDTTANVVHGGTEIVEKPELASFELLKTQNTDYVESKEVQFLEAVSIEDTDSTQIDESKSETLDTQRSDTDFNSDNKTLDLNILLEDSETVDTPTVFSSEEQVTVGVSNTDDLEVLNAISTLTEPTTTPSESFDTVLPTPEEILSEQVPQQDDNLETLLAVASLQTDDYMPSVDDFTPTVEQSDVYLEAQDVFESNLAEKCNDLVEEPPGLEASIDSKAQHERLTELPPAIPIASTVEEKSSKLEIVEELIKTKIEEKDKPPKQKLNEPLVINVDTTEKEKIYSPKITIKPIKPPEDYEEGENKGSLKMTITKQADNTHSILKIYDPEHDAIESQNIDDQSVPKLVIKQPQSPKMSTRSSKVFSPSTSSSQRSASPRITIKPIPKPEDPVAPLKITIKPVMKPEQKHSPKLTIKPIPKPEDETVISPRLTIKPIVRPDEDIEQKVHSPRITIKPIVKPADSVEVIPSSPRVTIKPILKPVEEVEQISPKITIKPIVKPIDLNEEPEETVKERIVLKINKGTIPSNSKEEKSEKLAKIKLKLKEGGHPQIVQPVKRAPDSIEIVSPKKQRMDYESSLTNVEITPITSATHSKLKEMLCRNTDPIPTSSVVVIDDDEDEQDISFVEAQSKPSPIVISEESNQDSMGDVHMDMRDPLAEIPVFEITPDTVKTLNPIVPPEITIQVPAVVITPRKRGRPRKVPLQVREDFKDIKEEETKPVIESTRPKRSCRGPSVRTTLGIKPRKPRGPGRGRGGKRGMGTRGSQQDMSLQALKLSEK